MTNNKNNNKSITMLDVEGIMLKTFEDTIRFFQVYIRGLEACLQIEKDLKVKEGIQIAIKRAKDFISKGEETYKLVRTRKIEEINSICQIEEMSAKISSGNTGKGN